MVMKYTLCDAYQPRSLHGRSAILCLLFALAATGCDEGTETPSFEALIQASTLEGNAPMPVQFEARHTGPLAGTFTFAWDFGDGESSEEENPAHVFAAAGSYEVTLTVTDTSGGGRGTASTTITVSDAADLQMENVQFTPQRLRAGAEMTVSWTVRNEGAPVIGDVDQVIFLSEDEAWDASDIEIARLPRSGAELTDGPQSHELSLVLLESVMSGDYRLGVAADPRGLIGDSAPDNNVDFASASLQVRNPTDTGPDLVICGLSIPAFTGLPADAMPTAQLDDQLAVEVCLGNNGNRPIPLARYSLFLSQDDVLDDDDIRVGDRGGIPLGPGERSLNDDDLIDLSGEVTPGDWYLFAVADPDEEVEEQQEDNNTRVLSTPFRVVEPGEIEGIDLVVRNFTLESERVYYGQTLPGSITLVNRGDTDQQRFFVVRISAEPIDGGSATQIDSINVPSLAAGAEEVLEFRAPINRRLMAGDYRIIAEADPTNSVTDGNRANNRRAAAGLVELGGEPSVDAVVAQVTLASTEVAAGSSLTLTARIGNAGTDASGGLDALVALSTDSVYDSEDVIVGRFNIDPIEGGAEVEVESTVDIPLDLDQQVIRWRVVVVVDPNNTLTGELDEDNNERFAPTDLVVTGAMGGCAEDEQEPNNARADAIALEADARYEFGICDDADWFSVEVPAGQLLDVGMTYDAEEANVSLRITNGDDQLLALGEGAGGRLSAFLAPEDAVRTLYIGVVGGAGRVAYTLDLGLRAPEGPANLRIRDLELAPVVAAAGAPIAASFQLVNVGGEDAEPSQGSVYLHSIPSLMGASFVESAALPAVPAGGAVAVDLQFGLPMDQADGDYIVIVQADSGNAVEEADEDDNTAFGDLRVDADEACAPDGLEPNVSPFEAGDDALPRVIEAGAYANLFSCRGDDDWYAVDLAEGQSLQVTVNFQNAEGDLDVVLYGPDGQTVVQESAGFADVEQVGLARAEMAGRYFIRIFMNPGDVQNGVNRYDFNVEIADADACMDDGYEPNGDLESAELLPDGRHELVVCPGDVDWYRFAIPAGNTVSWQVNAAGATIELALFDEDGAQLDAHDRRIAHQAQRNGMYYLRVTVESEEEVVYELRVSGVSGVDLEATGLQLSRFGVEPGADLRARVEVANRRGDVARDIAVQFLLSADEAPSEEDVVLAETVVARLNGAAMVTLNQRLTVPPNAVSGDYYVLAVVDPDREIADLRLGNNVDIAQLNITAACVDDDDFANEGPGTATPLDPAGERLEDLSICPHTRDWYTIDATDSGLAVFEIRFDHDAGDLDLQVLGADLSALGASRGEGDVERVEVALDGPETLYIGVDGFDDAANAYTLTWNVP